MKMNKIVLASLLSVSLLGASTSVFASDDDNATTATSFTVQPGTRAFTPNPDDSTKKVITSKLTFEPATIAKLLQGTYSDQKAFNASVTDTTGETTHGWELTATYHELTNPKDPKGLGETLKIGDASLTKVQNSGVAYSVTAKEDADALADPEKKGTIAVGSDTAATLTIPSVAAVQGEYTGSVDWALNAGPENK